jgi:hypothetical protein
MKRLYFVNGFVLLSLLAGCAARDSLLVPERTQGNATPVIVQVYAAPEIRPGDTWKVYLSAHDPDGDMRNIHASIRQPGMASHPGAFLRIAEANRERLAGYVYLNTQGIQGLNFTTLTLSIELEDRAGYFSPPAVFPLSFNSGARQQPPPPPGLFPEKDLGPIMIILKALPDGGDQNSGEYGD